MKTINRTVVTIISKEPYIEWANGFDDNGPKIKPEFKHATSILIPVEYDEYNYEDFLKAHYKYLFEEELAAWMDDETVWPEERSYEKFKDWFEIVASDTVIELGEGPLIIEEL